MACHSLIVDNTYSMHEVQRHRMPLLYCIAHFELNTVPALKRALELLADLLKRRYKVTYTCRQKSSQDKLGGLNTYFTKIRKSIAACYQSASCHMQYNQHMWQGDIMLTLLLMWHWMLKDNIAKLERWCRLQRVALLSNAQNASTVLWYTQVASVVRHSLSVAQHSKWNVTCCIASTPRVQILSLCQQHTLVSKSNDFNSWLQLVTSAGNH